MRSRRASVVVKLFGGGGEKDEGTVPGSMLVVDIRLKITDGDEGRGRTGDE